MAEPNKQQIGDGSDSYGAAVQNAAKAAKQAANVGAQSSQQRGQCATHSLRSSSASVCVWFS